MSAYPVNALINVKLRHTCFKFVWLVYFCWNKRLDALAVQQSEPANIFFIYFYLSRGACPRDLHNMIAYTSCRPLLRPCNKYILNTERKVFNYIWRYFLCGEFTIKKEYIFRVGKRCKIFKKCSKMQLRDIG